MKAKKNIFKTSLFYSLTLGACLVLIAGCTPRSEVKKPVVYRIAHRQLPPEPVYSRLRLVHVPETMPLARANYSPDRPRILPVIHLELDEDTLEDAAAALAATARYSSYCASSIANQKVSLNQLGTIDELAGELAAAAGIRVVVDHENRQVRFFAQPIEQPRFFEGEGYEY